MLKERAQVLAVCLFALDLTLAAAAFLAAYWLRERAVPGARPGHRAALPAFDLPAAAAARAGDLGRPAAAHPAVPLAPHGAAAGRSLGRRPRLLDRRRRLHPDPLRPASGRARCSQTTRSAVSGSCSSPSARCVFLLTEKLALRLTSRYVRTPRLQLPHRADRGHEPLGAARSRDRSTPTAAGVSACWASSRTGDESGSELQGPLPLSGARRGGRHPAHRGEHVGGRRDLRRPPPRPGPPGGPFPQPPGAGHPHPLRARPLPAHPGARWISRSWTACRSSPSRPRPTSQLQLMAKRALDVALSSLLLFIGLPMVLLIALVIKLTSGGNDPVPPDPLRPERPVLHALQVPHDGGGRRGAARASCCISTR